MWEEEEYSEKTTFNVSDVDGYQYERVVGVCPESSPHCTVNSQDCYLAGSELQINFAFSQRIINALPPASGCQFAQGRKFCEPNVFNHEDGIESLKRFQKARSFLRVGDVWGGTYRPLIVPGRGACLQADILDCVCKYVQWICTLMIRNQHGNQINEQSDEVERQPAFDTNECSLPVEGCFAIMCNIFKNGGYSCLQFIVPLETQHEIWALTLTIWESLFLTNEPFIRMNIRLAEREASAAAQEIDLSSPCSGVDIEGARASSINKRFSTAKDSTAAARASLGISDSAMAACTFSGVSEADLLLIQRSDNSSNTCNFCSKIRPVPEVTALPLSVEISIDCGRALFELSNSCLKRGVFLDTIRAVKHLHINGTIVFTLLRTKQNTDFVMDKLGRPLGLPTHTLLTKETEVNSHAEGVFRKLSALGRVSLERRYRSQMNKIEDNLRVRCRNFLKFNFVVHNHFYQPFSVRNTSLSDCFLSTTDSLECMNLRIILNGQSIDEEIPEFLRRCRCLGLH